MLFSSDVSAQGVELTTAVNHVGHAAVFNLLLPLLKRSGARVVSVGSNLHKDGKAGPGIAFGARAPHLLSGASPPARSARLHAHFSLPAAAGSGNAAYGDSKLLTVAWAFEVQRRYGADGVSCASVDPGVAPFTGLGPKAAWVTALRWTLVPFVLMPLLFLVGLGQTPSGGGGAEVAALDAAISGDCVYFFKTKPGPVSEQARDKALGKHVWAETQSLLRKLSAEHGINPAIALSDV